MGSSVPFPLTCSVAMFPEICSNAISKIKLGSSERIEDNMRAPIFTFSTNFYTSQPAPPFKEALLESHCRLTSHIRSAGHRRTDPLRFSLAPPLTHLLTLPRKNHITNGAQPARGRASVPHAAVPVRRTRCVWSKQSWAFPSQR